MKIRVNMTAVSLFFVFAISLDCFYLLDNTRPLFMGLGPNDCALFIVIVWIMYYSLKYIKVKSISYSFAKWVVVFLILTVLSAIQSNLLYGQSIFLGVNSQRKQIVWMLMYFVIGKLIKCNRISIKELENILYLVAIIQIILFISQSLLENRVSFMYVATGFRNGRTRYYYNPIILDYIFLASLDRIINGEKEWRIFYFVMPMAILYDIIFVQNYRLTGISILICSLIFIIMFKSKLEKKVFYGGIALIIGLILFNTDFVQQIVETVIGNNYDAGTKIRFAGKMLYMKTFLKHPIVGGGIPSDEWRTSLEACGYFRNIFLVDNGAWAILYCYGGIGIIWLVSLWKKLLMYGWNIKKKYNELVYFLLPVFCILVCSNELHWFWDYGIVFFTVFLCLIEAKNEKTIN